MAVDTENPAPPLTRDETGSLFAQTMALVGLTAGAFAAGAWAARDFDAGWSLPFFLVAFGLLLWLSAAVRREEPTSTVLLLSFGLFLGGAVASTLGYYIEENPQALWNAGGATALFVAGFGSLGYVTRRDLSRLAPGLTWALFGLILFGVIQIFVHTPNGSVIYAVLGLVLFAGLTAYDFQRLRVAKDLRSAPVLAASIFLDILNVFLFFLSFGGRE